MRVAVIERFADPSRRCDPTLVADPADDVVVWELGLDEGDHLTTWGEVVRALPAWLRLRLSPRRLRAYLVACRQMRGWRRVALVRAPGWIRQARDHEVDAVACFSTDGFALATLLAEETGTPCRELLARGTQYFGEFAFELLAVVPYAHWLFEQGRLEFTVSTSDTRCLYPFSPRHIERDTTRRYVPITEYPIGEAGEEIYDHEGFPTHLDASRWSPPRYRELYSDDRFGWTKPLLVICNKTSDERYLGSEFAINSLPVELLLELIGLFAETHTVVYDRPREADIVGDHAELRDPGDIEAVNRAFPEVVIIQDLHDQHPELTFNELQMRVFANCERFVSVLGGASYLASYFGGTNIVFAQQGWEIDANAYEHWFDRFSGARVIEARTPAELLSAAQREFVTD